MLFVFVSVKVKMNVMQMRFNTSETEQYSGGCRVERGPLSIRVYHQHIGQVARLAGCSVNVDRDQHGPLLYLLEDCGHKEAHVDLEPADSFLNARHRKLQIVGLAIIICGSKVVRTEGAQQQGQK